MSATITLSTVAKDVKWVPGPFYSLTPEEIESPELQAESRAVFEQITAEAEEIKDDIIRKIYIDDEMSKRDPLYVGYWSDRNPHGVFRFFKCSRKSMHTRNKRMGDYMATAKQYFGDCIESGYDGVKNPERFLVLNEILYRQGWFFKKELFKNESSMYYAFNKEDSIKLLKRFVDISTEEGMGAYRVFMNKLNEFSDDDRFVFEIAW